MQVLPLTFPITFITFDWPGLGLLLSTIARSASKILPRALALSVPPTSGATQIIFLLLIFFLACLARHAKKNIKSKNIICVAPDVGGTERARALGKILDADLAIVDKRRPKPGQSKVMNVIGNVKGKTCIIVDDIIDSGGTIVNAAKALKDRGAKEVFVYITHGVLSGEAVEKIKKSVIKKLVITDTIDNHDKIKNVKNIEVLPISTLMGEAIKRISNSTSVSDLFK
jgi:ribose-phosphate pyrophosphokinase